MVSFVFSEIVRDIFKQYINKKWGSIWALFNGTIIIFTQKLYPVQKQNKAKMFGTDDDPRWQKQCATDFGTARYWAAARKATPVRTVKFGYINAKGGLNLDVLVFE